MNEESTKCGLQMRDGDEVSASLTSISATVLGPFSRLNSGWKMTRRKLCIALGLLVVWCDSVTWSQSAPGGSNLPWHPAEERTYGQEAQQISPRVLPAPSDSKYSLTDLIAFAESHNPETRAAWEAARSLAEALGVARSELYPSLVALALSQTNRQEAYLGNRYYRQTFQSFDLGFDLKYTIFDFGGRAGRIGHAREQLLAADFDFNDAHRRIIYQVEIAYYKLLNAIGQEDAARADLANAEAVKEAAEASLKNGLATLPDVLEARSAVARGAYDLQAAIGAEDVARGNLAVALGTSPVQPIPVQSIDQISNPEQVELSIDDVIDRAVNQRPDLLRQVAEIRAANARLKETKAAYFPSLRVRAHPDPQSLYGMQQELPWGHTAALDGEVSFSLNWTIFDGGARKHALAEAGHEARTAEAKASAARDEVENGVWTAYSNLKTAFRQREAAASLLQAASQSYQAALDSYHYGVRNLLDVTEAQRTLAQARSADVLARTQVLETLADLAFQTADSVQPKSVRQQP
jgi:outer membrane protein